jgi:DMSO/TMAO reductase YedYZ molybdopterin-dependent catalytic subunit
VTVTDDTDPNKGTDDTPAPTKLTTTKQRWAKEGRFLTGRTARPQEERLPPGQHIVKDWPVLDLGVQPDISHDGWRLDIFGTVERPVVWDWPTFQALPQSHELSDIHCVTSWSRYDNAWDGVSTADVLAAAEPKPETRFVVLHSYDGYTTNVPLQDFEAPDALLAHTWQGMPLTREHGGPVRLVIPHLYFWKSAKWLQRIEFTIADRPSFWETRGYHNRGDPWAEQRYSSDD